MEEKMRISKEVMSGAVKIFDKHFPKDRSMKINEKKQIVKFFINLNEFANKNNIQVSKKHFEYLQKH
jgi:hypothetical protein